MKKGRPIIITTFLVILLAFSLHPAQVSSTNTKSVERPEVQQTPVYDGIKPEELDIPILDELINYQLNIKFLGFDQSRINLPILEDNLPHWYAPIDRFDRFYGSSDLYDTNYSLSYDFEFINDAVIDNMRDYFFESANFGDEPIFSQDQNDTYYIPSAIVEEYLYNEFMPSDQPTFFVIDLYTINPSKHHEHLYNASEIDLDGDSIARPYGSMYQNAGGGNDKRLLWLDLSVGGIQYRDSDTSSMAGVNDTLIPNVWDDRYSGDNSILSEDIANYITTAVELRYLPSYLYSPAVATEKVQFEMQLVNLDDSGYDFYNEIDETAIVNKYSELNPNIEWVSYLDEWDWESDTTFSNMIADAQDDYDPSFEQYNASKILEFLSGMYTTLFNSSTEEVFVVPIFLFALPGEWSFDTFLGIANNNFAEFGYVVSVGNVYWSTPGYKMYNDQYAEVNDMVVAVNDFGYFWTSLPEGDYFEIFEINASVDIGTFILYVMDEENFIEYEVGDLSDFDPILTVPDFSGSISVNVSTNITDIYYFVLENTDSISSQIDIFIDQYRDRSFGFTFVTMHEIGHGLGISHPHDGYSWEGNYLTSPNSDYLAWLWDMSYTQMTYAGHHNNISTMDKDTYQRGIIPIIYELVKDDFDSVLNDIKDYHDYIPEMYVLDFQAIVDDFNEARNHFINHADIQNLDLTLDLLFDIKDNTELLASIDWSEELLTSTVNFVNNGTTSISEFRYRLELDRGISQEDSFGEQSTLTFNGLVWTDFNLTILHDGEVIAEYIGVTWDFPDTVYVDVSPPPDNDEENGSFLNYSSFAILVVGLFTLILIRKYNRK